MSNIHHQQTSKRNRPTKALLEYNLNEVYRLMIAGMTNRDIIQQLKINDRTFRRYVKKIRDRNVTDQLAKRQEYFLDDVKLAKDRLLMAKRYNLAIVNNDETEAKEKIEALKLDAALTMTLLKLDYEGTILLRALNNTNGNDDHTSFQLKPQILQLHN